METTTTIGFLIMGAIYFAPSLVAVDKKKVAAIFALNLLLGWTFIGWVLALCWALADDKRK